MILNHEGFWLLHIKKERKAVEKIKPCPFCGSKKVEICRTNVNACWVSCVKCDAETSSAAYREDAIKNWNQRRYYDGYSRVVEDGDKEYNR